MTSTPRASPSLGAPGRSARTIAIVAVALVVGIAGAGLYDYLESAGTPTLVLYTYPSLFAYGCNGSVLNDLLGEFEAAHHVAIEVEYPSGDLLSTLESEKGTAGADLVVGLDELTSARADEDGLLVPYTSPALPWINASLVAELSPDHAVTPYEYGYLGIDYSTGFNAAAGGEIGNASLSEFAENSSWARQLVYEDPATLDITGDEFLAWEIEYYTTVLHQPWSTFWTAISGRATGAPDYDTAFDVDFDPVGPGAPLPDGGQAVVSYTTDPAYASVCGSSTGLGPFDTTTSTWNGTDYGWKTIYGIGIVAGTRHLSLDQEFVNWFLSPAVQSAIPLNEWEYPANATIGLPPSYASLRAPASIVALNDALSPSELSANLPGWISAWQALGIS